MLWMPTNRRPCANDCTNSRKNSRTASRFALRPKVKQEHNEADGGAHGLSASVFGSRQARQGASVRVSGRSPDPVHRAIAMCILAYLILHRCRHGWEVHHVRSKKPHRCKNSAPDKQHTRGHWHRRVSAQCLHL